MDEGADLVGECARAIRHLADDCLDKTERGYGFDEPRTLEKACHLGVLALRRGWLDVFMEIRAAVAEFEPRFFAKYLSDVPAGVDPHSHNVMGLPHHDQLLRELLRWRRDMREWRSPNLLGDSESMVADRVTLDDIDRFVFEVWRVAVRGSAVVKELQRVRADLAAALEALVMERREGLHAN